MRSAPHHTRARYVGFSSLGPPRGRRWTRSVTASRANNARTKPIRRGISDRVIVLMHHEETGNSRIVRRVVRCHQPDEYGGAARSDSRSGCGPVDWRRHVFRSGACRHRHHAAQTSVGSGSRCRGLSEGLTGFESRTSRTPAGSPALLEPKVDSLPLRRVKHRVGSILLERAAARSPLPRRRRGRGRRRYLFRLANKESMRNREDEGLLGLIVGHSDHAASPLRKCRVSKYQHSSQSRTFRNCFPFSANSSARR